MQWKQYIGGEWTTGTGGTRPVINPFNGETVAQIVVGDVSDARRALERAHGAFTETRALPAFRRYEILRNIEAGIAARRDEFARGIVAEGGKTIRDARGEVDRAILVFSLAAEEARRFGGEVMPLDLNAVSTGRVGLTRRFPVGTVAALTPFNFPLNLVAHKVAPALAIGAPVILKPAERTPLTALRLAEVIEQSGYPKEAFSVLTPAEPKAVAELLTTDERTPILSFTGSDAVGWHLKALANKKRVTLELGGNAAVVVGADADIEFAATRCVWGAFANAGQVCISVQRIFVERSVFEPFINALVEKTRALKVGDPSDETTELGPMTTPQARDKAVEMIREAEAAGATILLRGESSDYAHLSPTILTGTTPDMRVCSTEAFAPLVVVEPVDSFADGIARANEGRYGLQAGIFTQRINDIFAAWNTLEVGGVIVNDAPQYRVDVMPYGGERDSGFGREGVRYAMEEMTSLRLLAFSFS